jgi:hypothetical protein
LTSLFALLATLWAPGWARAEIERTESRQYGAAELKFGPYRPAIDENPDLDGTPYADVFNDDNMFLTVIELDWQIVHPPGFSVGLGGTSGSCRRTPGPR